MIKRKSKLNQIWYYSMMKDTMFYGRQDFNNYEQKEFKDLVQKSKRSIFIRFHYYPKTDTISISESLRCIAEDGFPFWKDSESYVVLAKEKFNFNEDFSNENAVKTDTFFCLEKDNGNKMPAFDQKHAVAFGKWFTTPGKKIIRGFVEENLKSKPTNYDKSINKSKRVYFERIIYVKDTLK